jgi:transcriptional regulator with PAS, ATPase and Fis domain
MTHLTAPQTLEKMEAVLIEQALQQHGGNRTAAAKSLGIDPSTLFRKLKKRSSK